VHEQPDIAPALVEAVRSYFGRHPLAADSVEGIARWRLLEENAHLQLESTARALRWLVDRGELVEEARPGMTALFRLATGGDGAPAASARPAGQGKR